MLDRRIRSEVIINTGFALANALGILLSYSLATRLFSAVALDALLLGRRLVAAGANLTQVGVSQTLQRYLSVHTTNGRRKCAYLQQAILIITATGAGVLLLGALAQGQLARLLAADVKDGGTFCMWLLLTVAATGLCFLSTSLLMAERKMFAAGVLQFLNINGLFLLGLWYASHPGDITVVFKVIGMGTMLLSAAVALAYLTRWRRFAFSTPRSEHRQIAGEYVGFGLPRTLTSFLDAGIILVGPWMLRTQPGQTTAFLVALTVLRLTQAMLAPVSQVLGLGAARMLGTQQADQLSQQTRRLFGGLCYLGLLAPCLLAPWSETLVQIWLADPELVAAVDFYLQALIWATPPLTIFYGLRGVVDMRWTFPFNLLALSTSLLSQLLLYGLLHSTWGAATAALLAVTAGLWVLGLLSVYWIRADLSRWQDLGLLPLAFLSAMIWLVNYLFSTAPSVANAMAAGLLSAACIGFAVKLAPPEFVRHVFNRRRPTEAKSSGFPSAAPSAARSEATA